MHRVSKPACSKVPETSRLMWQFPNSLVDSGSIRRCHRCTDGSGASPCSRNTIEPPGRRIRCSSSNTVCGSWTGRHEQRPVLDHEEEEAEADDAGHEDGQALGELVGEVDGHRGGATVVGRGVGAVGGRREYVVAQGVDEVLGAFVLG